MATVTRRPADDDPEATAAVRMVVSPADLLTAHGNDRLRDRLGLEPGQAGMVLTRGPGLGSSIRLAQESVTIGRSAAADIILDDVSVSRRHARIDASPIGYRMSDTGSLNGTYVNGLRTDAALLVHGDEIRIGLFKFVFLSRRPRAPDDRTSSPGGA